MSGLSEFDSKLSSYGWLVLSGVYSFDVVLDPLLSPRMDW
jgi:hypothetical protein